MVSLFPVHIKKRFNWQITHDLLHVELFFNFYVEDFLAHIT